MRLQQHVLCIIATPIGIESARVYRYTGMKIKYQNIKISYFHTGTPLIEYYGIQNIEY